MSSYKGIDISHWQTVDYKSLPSDLSFVIMKISQMKVKDSMFNNHYNGCSKYHRGGYIYLTAKNVEQAKTEANFALTTLAKKNLPAGVWLDMEDSSISGFSKDVLTDIINTEATILKNAGYNVGIYCNLSWYNTKLDSSLRNVYPFWIARYPASDDGQIHNALTPQGKTAVVAWQYSSKGKVSGISGNVDMDIAFKDITTCFKSTSVASVNTSMSSDANPFKEPSENIKQGSSNKEGVKWVQWYLWAEFGLIGKSGVDGIFGVNTLKAVKTAQKKLGLIADGIVGQKTREAFKQALE